MNILRVIKNFLGFERPSPKPAQRRVRSSYDAAQTTEENSRHWSWSDGLSARAANSWAVRKKLRDRARYECDNNSYAEGIVDTYATHVIGTGPRIQVSTSSQEVNRQIERRFSEWANSSWVWTTGESLAEKLRTMVRSKLVDGEGIAVLATNPQLATSVKLDVRLIESEQMSTPFIAPNRNRAVDGIIFDECWNPIEYHILKTHPGDYYATTVLDYDRVRAADVIHWFRRRRPGQARGVPELTQSLPLFAQLRRYTLASLTAAETAANFAALLESSAPPDGDSYEPSPFQTLEIERGMMTVAPAGWKLGQLKSEQPTTTYGDFKRELINEIARAINMPYNVAACNSSSYNYSSGRLDHQTYHGAIRVVRSHCERVCLTQIFSAWYEEAIRIPGFLPSGAPMSSEHLPRQWHWDGLGHVDPQAESGADAQDLKNVTRTLADICAEDGRDWEQVIEQRGVERRRMAEAGLSQEDA